MVKINSNDNISVLIAEDERIYRRVLEVSLSRIGYNVITTKNGQEALDVLRGDDSPQIAVLDWIMPEMDGIDVIKKVRAKDREEYVYMILLTTKSQQEEILEGLAAGADDYLLKPVSRKELNARIRVGLRVVNLEQRLKRRVNQLQAALEEVRQLKGMLPICSYCKKIRDDKKYWTNVEDYVASHTEAQFSHSICPECYEKHVLPEFRKLDSKKDDEENG